MAGRRSTKIVTALRTLYTGTFLATGGSKGGMTAMFYRRFFPDDVDGTVPYVAPLSFGAPDERYPPFIDTLGPDACRQAVRDLATEMLMNRRAALEAATQTEATAKGYQYTRVLLGPAVESAIDSLEWSFWQYYGVTACPQVPAITATDAAMFTFLDTISPPSDSDDEQTGFFEAYYYQAYFQLGYPDGGAAYLHAVYLMYTDADYLGSLPTAQIGSTTAARRCTTSTTSSSSAAIACCSCTASGIRGRPARSRSARRRIRS